MDYVKLKITTIDRIIKEASSAMRAELMSLSRRTAWKKGDLLKLAYEITVEFSDEKKPSVRVD